MKTSVLDWCISIGVCIGILLFGKNKINNKKNITHKNTFEFQRKNNNDNNNIVIQTKNTNFT